MPRGPSTALRSARDDGKKTPAEILKKIRALEIKTKGLVQTIFAGDYHSVFKGRGMNFDEVREYQPGDEIRAIDWNVTARLGTAFVKKFTEERELTVVLVVDVSASGNFGSVSQSKRELAAEVACLLAFSAIRNNDKVGLLLFSDRVELFIPPKKGRSHTLRIIREILFFEPEGRGTKPALALDYLNNVMTRRVVVFFISDFQTSDFSRELSVSGRRHDFIALHIQDEREENLPNVGIITLEDAETGEQIEINTADRSTRTRFNALAETHRAELNRTLDRKSTRLNSSHRCISYAVFCLKKKKKKKNKQYEHKTLNDHHRYRRALIFYMDRSAVSLFKILKF